jgi:hypothetical protein
MNRLAGVVDPKLKIKATKAQEICDTFELSKDAQPLLNPEIAPLPFLDLLEANEFYVDALQFLARALPKREAVWWSATCARELTPDAKRPELTAGLEAAEAWVYRPNEDTRRGAEKAANAIKASHPTKWTAMAAFWSGGSLAPADKPEVKPPEDFTAKAVAGAVMMIAALDPTQSVARNKKFIAAAREIANGGTGRVPGKK